MSSWYIVSARLARIWYRLRPGTERFWVQLGSRVYSVRLALSSWAVGTTLVGSSALTVPGGTWLAVGTNLGVTNLSTK